MLFSFSSLEGVLAFNEYNQRDLSYSVEAKAVHESEFKKREHSVAGGLVDRYYHLSYGTEGFEENTLAVVWMPKILMRNDSWYDKGVTSVVKELRMMGESSKVKEVVLRSGECYGGQTFGIEELSDLIENFEAKYKKPLTVLIDGICASGGMWAFAKAKKIYVTSQTAIAGSIGTMATWYDESEAMGKYGVKKVSVYATDSVLKNAEGKDADNGNYDKLIEGLDKTNKVFQAVVMKGRGKKLDLTKTVTNSKGEEIPEVLSGKVYHGQEIIDIGLADGFKTMQQIIDSHNNEQINTKRFFIKLS